MRPLRLLLSLATAGLAVSACSSESSVTPPTGDSDASFSSTFTGPDVTDGGKWVETMGFNDPSIPQVFTSALDPAVPGGRGLRLVGNNGDSFWLNFVPAASVRPQTPQIGGAITWRWYWKLIQGDGDGGYHPVAWGGDTVSPPVEGAVLTYTVVSGGGWTPWLQVFDAGASPDYQPRFAEADRLRAGEWYRHEVTWVRESADIWSIKFRIYDQANQIVYTTADFFDGFGGGSNRLDEIRSRQPNANFATEWTGFGNGVGGTVGSPHEQDRWAAIVSVDADVADIPYPIRGEGS